jgi:hypothetical protein
VLIILLQEEMVREQQLRVQTSSSSDLRKMAQRSFFAILNFSPGQEHSLNENSKRNDK